MEMRHRSCFFGTSLGSVLIAELFEDNNRRCFDEWRVQSTATDAIQHDFNPYVVGDACGDRHVDPHNSHPSQV